MRIPLLTTFVFLSVTTSTFADSQRPSTVENVNATSLSSSEVRLSWNKPWDDTGVVGYNLYRDDSYFTTIYEATNYIDNGLSHNREYQYYVVAFDESRNYSTKSGRASVITGDTAAAPPPVNDSGAQTESAPPPDSGSAVPDDYQLVFNDEFDNGNIDASKWNTRYRWGPDWVINNEEQYYVDILDDPEFGRSPFYIADGKLNISASKTPDHLLHKANHKRYLSGAMTTHNKFKMKFGFVEMRAKLPRGRGMWPAFWMLHEHNWGNRPEIDIMEMLGEDTTMVYQTYHYYDDWNLRSTPSFQVPGPDYASDYHTYGMKWEPGRIIWYVDGQETNRYESGAVSNEEMYILMNIALGGTWGASPDDTTNFPATFSIDYVRAYQRR